MSKQVIAKGHWGIVYEWGDGTILKRFRNELPDELITYEFNVATLAYQSGIPTPKPLRVHSDGEYRGIIFEKIEGINLARYVLKKPWKILWAIKEMALLLKVINNVTLDGAYSIKTSFIQRLISVTEVSATDKKRALSLLDQLEEGNSLCHHDYHPANIIINNNQLYVIDWGGACQGNYLADVAHTYVINAVDGIPEDTPWLIQKLMFSFRSLYLQLFLYHYAQQHPDLTYKKIRQKLSTIIAPVAVARLSYYGDFETPELLRLITKHLNSIDETPS